MAALERGECSELPAMGAPQGYVSPWYGVYPPGWVSQSCRDNVDLGSGIVVKINRLLKP